MNTRPRLRVPLGAPELPLSRPSRALRLASDAAIYGAAVAAINYVSASPTPLDPEVIWRMFCRRWPAPVEALIYHHPIAPLRRGIIERLMAQSHAAGIEYHYDLSNEFYALMLDRQFMFYSCADFAGPHDTLEQAQARKADHLLSLIEPRAGEKILELGCGWGSMLRHIHASTGDKAGLCGYTLSGEQQAHIERHYGFDVVLEDFTTADLGEGRYDKAYSIGAMEHVRPDEIVPLLRKVHRALRPGGRLVQHFFSLEGDDPWPTAMVNSQLFFPGSLLSLHSHHLACAVAAGFEVTHDSTHDYRPTLRAWFDRLVASRAEAHRLVGVQVTNKYLAFLASSWTLFEWKMATLHRLVLRRA